ncbi:MAG: thiamine pyrophosphate-dependent enzyme [Planctomycetota bacterium]|jgi:3D-(3,5/4)-trihydroxycyclohexane-1,2-dione acylhydrolase (decyclizing)
MMQARAKAIREHRTLAAALDAGALPAFVDVTVAEALVLGLLRQGVAKYLAILGHGNTALAEVLRVYEQEGVVRVFQCRNEVAMAHAATALRWHYGETSAVLTSIGPGALQALAGSLTSASNGVGVWHIYGDETTHGEGYNMQQIPKREQHLFGRLTAVMGESFTLYDPESLRDCLRRGAARVYHPFRAGPFYVQLPLNVQPERIPRLNLAALPGRPEPSRVAPVDDTSYLAAAELIRRHRRVGVKVGGGARRHPAAIEALLGATDGVAALSPGALGVLPDAHPRNLHVGGSKGTLSGNYAMANADLVIVVGSRAVCQADCSGTGFEKAEAVININGDRADATHYNRTVALVGSIDAVVERLVAVLDKSARPSERDPSAWLSLCAEQKDRWRALREERCAVLPLDDPVWGRPVLTQPAAIGVVDAFARRVGAVKYFDAGDVQANGFQIAADDAPDQTFTDTGASYMGFAASALLASAIADEGRYCIALVGDGSFFMNPQILVDGIAHGVRGAVVVLDNRRMAAISALQIDQYGCDFATCDSVAVDYVALAAAVRGVNALFGGFDHASLETALERAHDHDGLSLVHVPVYFGSDPRGGMGVYGRWNVGDWCDEVQDRYHSQPL